MALWWARTRLARQQIQKEHELQVDCGVELATGYMNMKHCIPPKITPEKLHEKQLKMIINETPQEREERKLKFLKRVVELLGKAPLNAMTCWDILNDREVRHLGLFQHFKKFCEYCFPHYFEIEFEPIEGKTQFWVILKDKELTPEMVDLSQEKATLRPV